MNLLHVDFIVFGFIEYMLARKTLLDCTNLFPPNDYKKNIKLIYKHFKDQCGRRRKSRV